MTPTRSLLSKAEINAFRRTSNWRALMMLAANWGIIIAAFAIPVLWTNPLTIVLSVLVLGGRQLGLGILVHECAHRAFMSSKSANDLVGQWFCGIAINLSVHDYRRYHMQHHRFAGTDRDPDRVFVEKYPVGQASMRRKLLRDITGRTGLRDTLARLAAFDLGKHWPWLGFHLALLAVLTIAGASWAYLLWWAAEIFVLPLLSRLRQIGEHGVATNRSSEDSRENTSTTLVSPLERLFIAPNFVNYHLEHHEFATVPAYRLQKLHRTLRARGYHDGFDCISSGYLDVLRRAVA